MTHHYSHYIRGSAHARQTAIGVLTDTTPENSVQRRSFRVQGYSGLETRSADPAGFLLPESVG
jgi:hypothetical protein